MRKKLSGLILVTTTGALLATTAGVPPSFASPDESRPAPALETRAGESYGDVWNILPPGSRGNITTLDVATLHGGPATDRKSVV